FAGEGCGRKTAAIKRRQKLSALSRGAAPRTRERIEFLHPARLPHPCPSNRRPLLYRLRMFRSGGVAVPGQAAGAGKPQSRNVESSQGSTLGRAKSCRFRGVVSQRGSESRQVLATRMHHLLLTS